MNEPICIWTAEGQQCDRCEAPARWALDPTPDDDPASDVPVCDSHLLGVLEEMTTR